MSRSKQRAARVKAVPWALLVRTFMVVGKRWTALSEKDRARLKSLVAGSRGRLGNLSARERNELRKLVRKLDVKRAGRELLPLLRGARGRRKRR